MLCKKGRVAYLMNSNHVYPKFSQFGPIHLLLTDGQNLMKLDEFVVHNFFKILMKNKKVLYIKHLTDISPSVKGR